MTTVRVVACARPRRRLRLVPLVERDEGAGDAEHHALDDAVADVVPGVDPALHLRPECAGVDADHQHTDDVAAEDTDGREHRRQQRHRDDARQEPRREHPLLRVDRHHLHRGQLFAGLHQSDLGVSDVPARPANSSPVTTGPSSRTSDSATSRPSDSRGAVAAERVIALEREHESDRQSGGRNDDQRIVADRVDLRDGQVEPLSAQCRLRTRSTRKNALCPRPRSRPSAQTPSRLRSSAAFTAAAPGRRRTRRPGSGT